jgi:SH3-like domain-containing protein
MGSPARPRTPLRRVGLLSRRTGKDKDGRIAVKEGGMNRDKRRINALALGRRDVLALACALILAPILVPPAALADPVGPVTKLPMPRFASLKTDRVNLREGPSKEHATKWVYERAGLPVEITAEFEIWRKVRDSEGIEGWVLHSLLSGRRTALVTPNKKGENSKLYARASASADLAATLQSGVIVNIRNCDGAWCLVDGDGFKGYMEQEKLWGVYPDEKIQ